MVALPSESRTTAAPEATSSKASSAVVTSAATRGGLPEVAQRPGRGRERGERLAGELGELDRLAPGEGVGGAERHEAAFGGENLVADVAGAGGSETKAASLARSDRPAVGSPKRKDRSSTCQPGWRLAKCSSAAGNSARPREVSVPTRSTFVSAAAASATTAAASSQSTRSL